MRVSSLVLFLACTAAVVAQDRITFIGVALDQETRRADEKLRLYLSRHTGINWAAQDMEYERVIDRLVSPKTDREPYVARVTPYVYIVAEMLGAKVEPLATYVSASTQNRVYRAYLVVAKKDFPTQPTLFDVVQHSRARAAKGERQRFVYHSRFSTSSYFVPSLYFRSQNIYHMPESTDTLIAIASEQIAENSSAKLVELVAEGKAGLAAVWDGTKKKFEPGGAAHDEFGRHVHFVELPTPMPNDLLVCATSLDPAVKERLRGALRQMGPDEIQVGDFRTWQHIRDAVDARQALADLRWLARSRAPAATVEIALHPGARASAATVMLLEAAREAVRLANTELVLFDDDFHVHIDYTWTLEPVHAEAVALRSRINGAGIAEQEFRISFRDAEDLTRRIVAVAQDRMHRIRYVWAYSSTPPSVVRDIALAIPEGALIRVQRISWLDPQRNKFLAGPVFNARIRQAGSFRYELEAEDFWRSGESVTSFDPLSNLSYRVYLTRPAEERRLLVVLTYGLVGLFMMAALTAVVTALRRR